ATDVVAVAAEIFAAFRDRDLSPLRLVTSGERLQLYVAVTSASVFPAIAAALLASSDPQLVCLFLETYLTLQSDVALSTASTWIHGTLTKFGWERLLSPLLSLLDRWSPTHLAQAFQLVASLAGVDPTPVCARLHSPFLGELVRACYEALHAQLTQRLRAPITAYAEATSLLTRSLLLEQYVHVTRFEVVAGTWLYDRLPTALLHEIAAYGATDACTIVTLVAQHPTSFPPIAVVAPAGWAVRNVNLNLGSLLPDVARSGPPAAFDNAAWGSVLLVDVMTATLLTARCDAVGWSPAFLEACYVHAGLALLPALVAALSTHPSLSAEATVVAILQRAPEVLRSNTPSDTIGHLARYYAQHGRPQVTPQRPPSMSDVQLYLLLTVLEAVTSTDQIDILVAGVLHELDGAPWAIHASRAVIYRLFASFSHLLPPPARLRLVNACLENHVTALLVPRRGLAMDDLYVGCDCVACTRLHRELLTSDMRCLLTMQGVVPRCLRQLVHEHSDRLVLEHECATGYRVRKTPLSLVQTTNGPDGDLRRVMALREWKTLTLQPPVKRRWFWLF
ncbi:hypothetical protein SDRG_15853, partial [Saprolegnia diclina VS20]